MTAAPPDQDVQPVDWATIDRALRDWLVERVPDVGERIIWENQDLPQPAYPYLSILRGAEADEGGASETRMRTLDADGVDVTEAGAGTPVTNEEIVYEPIRFTLTIQAHVDETTGANDPACNAMALLGKAKRSLALSAVNEALGEAGLSVVGEEELTDISLTINGAWLSRASLDVVFRTASVMSDSVGFIDKAQLVSQQLGVDITVDAS